MSQQVFTGMLFPKDSAGTKGTALLQLRNGIDEPITPITLWELDTESNLYLPPGTSANPKRPRMDVSDSTVTLSGSLLQEQLDQSDAVNNVLTFSDNLIGVDIYHEEDTAQTFVINGVTFKVPAGGWFGCIGGTPGATVTIPAGVTCTVGRWS
jgi:hypothetical protein